MAVTRRIKEIGGHWHTRPDKSRRTPEQAPDPRLRMGVANWENPMGCTKRANLLHLIDLLRAHKELAPEFIDLSVYRHGSSSAQPKP